jgi:riboflavin synthase
MGGHIMSGHVDGIGILRERAREGRSLRLFFEIPQELSRYVAAKGSIGMNGLSLTVNGCSDGRFDVNIVPHTADRTTIGDLRPGDEVNIETDVIAKYVESLLKGWSPGAGEAEKTKPIDNDFLRTHGFI